MITPLSPDAPRIFSFFSFALLLFSHGTHAALTLQNILLFIKYLFHCYTINKINGSRVID